MNLLTFDIEEWLFEKRRFGRVEIYAKYNRYLESILDKLDECKIKATFFCVGEMGVYFPDIVRKIFARGHEIGCHSNTHTWLNKMSFEECREDTRIAIDSLEQCIGEKVKSYRAPAFSVDANSKWVFEILSENGIERDSSVFPTNRDYGGFPSFGSQIPCLVKYNGICVKEFPICMTRVLGMEMAYSGGGYFRFFPISFVKKEISKNRYSILYFHIGDLIPEPLALMSKEEYERYFKEKGSLAARLMRHIKSNLGKKNAFSKMMKIVDYTSFVDLNQADELIDWDSSPIITL
jgi:polysaccharide deacetylase family protein (PEP-CTERM system associated)